MSRPAMDRASSFTSDDTSSTQSCIAVKPMRDSSPPSEASRVALSTPPTSVDPSPSVASEQHPTSPNRMADGKQSGKGRGRRPSGRQSLQAVTGKPSKSSLKATANHHKTEQKTVSTKTVQVRQGLQSNSTVIVKKSVFSTLDSWLSQAERVQPSVEMSDSRQESDLGPSSLKRKRVEEAIGTGSDNVASSLLQSDAPDKAPTHKRVRHSDGVAEPKAGKKTDQAGAANSTKAGALAARAKKVVSAARQSVRQVAEAVTSAASKVSKPVQGEKRSIRRSTRDAGAAPSNEEKAATALQDDSKKRQNKQMATRGRFYNGEPADEVIPLPNSFYLGKFGSDATYLDSMRQARGFRLGAEVFNPQPSSFVREGKDWSVTKGAKNAFAGNARATWARSELSSLPQSFCTCKPADACGVDCWNRTMEYECSDNNCAVGAALCKNRPFADLGRRLDKAEAVNNRQREHERVRADEEKRRPKYPSVLMSFDHGVEVFETAGKGYGVRAQRSFEPGQIIMEYFGEIIDQEEVENRMATVYKDSTDFYMMQFHDGFILDATKGSMCRFVNHSCQPNCEIRKMLVPTGAGKKASVEPRMALFAGGKGIQFDEELTYDYNFDPFSNRNVQKCLCGSEKCRGFLGPRQKAPVGDAGGKGKGKAAEVKKVEVKKTTAAAVKLSKSGVVFTSSVILKTAKRARF